MHDWYIQMWQVQGRCHVSCWRDRESNKYECYVFIHTLIDTTHDTLSRLLYLLHHVFIQTNWFQQYPDSWGTVIASTQHAAESLLWKERLQSMEHSQENSQDLDFPAGGQLEKLGVALFIIGNPLQSLMILFSAISMAMSISGTLCVLVLDALW